MHSGFEKWIGVTKSWSATANLFHEFQISRKAGRFLRITATVAATQSLINFEQRNFVK
jgi:hypothetical protein